MNLINIFRNMVIIIVFVVILRFIRNFTGDLIFIAIFVILIIIAWVKVLRKENAKQRKDN